MENQNNSEQRREERVKLADICKINVIFPLFSLLAARLLLQSALNIEMNTESEMKVTLSTTVR